MADAPAAAASAPAPAAPATLATSDTPAAVTQSAQAQADAAALAQSQTDAAARSAADAEAARVAALTPEQRTAEAEKKAAPRAAPEKYEPFKPPEGVTLDAELTPVFEAKAKQLGLSQAEAQELFDLGAKAVTKSTAQFQKQVTETQASWLAAAQADTEFGGSEAVLTQNMAVAKRALDAFATPELKTMLNESKLGNHPEIIRLMVRVGKAMSEDKFIPGQSVVPPRDVSDEARAKRLYPNQS